MAVRPEAQVRRGVNLPQGNKLGASGLEGVLEVALSDAEREALGASAEAVRGTMELVQL